MTPPDENETVACAKCRRCKNTRPVDQLWWCRDCASTLCSTCSLLQRHTEHRSVKWSSAEVSNSCVSALEERCQRRSRRASQAQLEISDALRDIETKLLEAIQQRLAVDNREDTTKINAIASHYGIDPEALAAIAASTLRHSDRLEVQSLDARVRHSLEELSIICGNDMLRDTLQSTDLGSTASSSSGVAQPPTDWHFRLLADEVNAFLSLPAAERHRGTDEASSNSPGETTTDSGIILNGGSSDVQAVISPPTATVESHNYIPQTSEEHHHVAHVVHHHSYESANVSPPSHFIDSSSQPTTSVSANNSPALPHRHSFQNQPQHARPPSRSFSTQTGLVNGDLDTISIATSLGGASNIDVTAYHFGSAYLSRPIDVTVLPGERLAISDSCGGVYITTQGGDVIQHIDTEGASASSLVYCAHRDQLLVSMLRKDKIRVIYRYSMADYARVGYISCPSEPVIESGRTRWIGSAANGDVYAVSGDNAQSAVWVLSLQHGHWLLIHHTQRTRYQYICLINNHPEKGSTVVLTADGVSGHLLMLFVDSSYRVVREYDMSEHWGISGVILSPASAIYDAWGNLLILDYATGKVWLLCPSSTKQPDIDVPKTQLNTSKRRGSHSFRLSRSKQSNNNATSKQQATCDMRVLGDIGAQNGIGLAAHDGWCFIACYARQAVRAVKYKSAI